MNRIRKTGDFGGEGSVHKGVSLRFPRFLKVRDDKSVDEASTSDFLAALYRKQEAKAPAAKKVDVDEVGDEEE